MTNREWLIAVLTVIATGALAACSGGEDAPSPASTAKAGQPVTVRAWKVKWTDAGTDKEGLTVVTEGVVGPPPGVLEYYFTGDDQTIEHGTWSRVDEGSEPGENDPPWHGKVCFDPEGADPERCFTGTESTANPRREWTVEADDGDGTFTLERIYPNGYDPFATSCPGCGSGDRRWP